MNNGFSIKHLRVRLCGYAQPNEPTVQEERRGKRRKKLDPLNRKSLILNLITKVCGWCNGN